MLVNNRYHAASMLTDTMLTASGVNRYTVLHSICCAHACSGHNI